MRFRIRAGVFAPSLAYVWSTFSAPDGADRGDWQRYGQYGAWDNNWDDRGSPPSGLKATNVQLLKQAQTVAVQTPKANRNIILIRHGQHVRAVQEPTARRLTDKGKQQVLETARHLKELQRLGFITSFSSIVSSGMIRAVESAELLFKELSQDASVMPWNLGSDNLLNEGSPCPPDPMPDWWTMEIQKGCWSEGAVFEAAFRRYFHRAPPEQEQDSFDIITCHGNIIRYFVCRAMQFSPQAWNRMSIANASITWILIKPDGHVHLHCINDVGHMPPEIVTNA